MPLRLQHVYVTNDDVRDDLPTYVLAKNVLRSVVNAADLRTPVAVFLYGVVPEDNARVVEIKAVAVPPQRATQRMVELPDELPQHPMLDDAQLVGVILTQPQENPSLTPQDAIFLANLISKHEELKGETILLTVAFTPGSLSLSSYCLTPKGFEWARGADVNAPNGWNPQVHSARAQLLLSDRILGSCQTPTGNVWNYSSAWFLMLGLLRSRLTLHVK